MSRKRKSDTTPLEAGDISKKNNGGNDTQPNRISSKTLRTTANTFFGTGVPTGRNESPTNQTDQHDGMSRNQMVQLLDPLISAFNAADFDCFAKTLRRMCAKDVEVVCKLIPPMPTLESSPDPPIFQQQHCLKGISALLLLWVLLHETHPDAVLQIIGKRICYRQLMESYELPIKLASVESDGEADPPSVSSKSNGSLSSPTNSDNSTTRSGRSGSYSTLPISILESIWKFSGSCVTTQTMDVLFTRLSQDSGLLAAVTAATTGAQKGAEGSAQAAASKPPPAAGATTGSANGQNSNGHSKLNPTALSEYISNFLTHERLRIPSAGHSRARATKRTTATTGTAAGAAVGAEDATENPPEQNRRYLIETRLVFNEKDQVSHWTFNLLAAESV